VTELAKRVVTGVGGGGSGGGGGNFLSTWQGNVANIKFLASMFIQHRLSPPMMQ